MTADPSVMWGKYVKSIVSTIFVWLSREWRKDKGENQWDFLEKRKKKNNNGRMQC